MTRLSMVISVKILAKIYVEEIGAPGSTCMYLSPSIVESIFKLCILACVVYYKDVLFVLTCTHSIVKMLNW